MAYIVVQLKSRDVLLASIRGTPPNRAIHITNLHACTPFSAQLTQANRIKVLQVPVEDS